MGLHTVAPALLLLAAASHAQVPASAPQPPAKRPAALASPSCLAVEYPAAARRSGAEGVTRLDFTIEPDGAVSNPAVARRSGRTREHALLDLAATQAIARCNFGPAPGFEPVRATQEFVWKLEPGLPQQAGSSAAR